MKALLFFLQQKSSPKLIDSQWVPTPQQQQQEQQQQQQQTNV